MSLMADDIEWYPLPEVVDDTLVAVETKSTLSTATSHYSTALSQSYLTPASSVGSCRSQSHGLMGTIQPYLRRPGNEDQVGRGVLTSKEDQTGSTHSSQSQSPLWTSSSIETTSMRPGRQANSLPKRVSTVMSCNTIKSSSAPSLKQRNSTSGSQPANAKIQTATSECRNPGQSESESSLSVHSVQQSDATSSTSEESDKDTQDRHSHTLTASGGSVIIDTVPSSPPLSNESMTHFETAPSGPPPPPPVSTSSYLPSRLFSTGVKFSQDRKRPATISLAELDRLWMDFLASSLGSDYRCEHLSGRSVHETPTASPPVDNQSPTPGSLAEEYPLVSSRTRDASIQTTPSLTVVPHTHNQHTSPQLSRTQQLPCLSELTLQESLKTLRPDFIRRCEERQRELRRHHELQSHSYCKVTTGKPSRCSNGQHNPDTRKEGGKTQRSPHFILIDVTRNRPKMSPVEMYRNSKKYWYKLPEVQQKVQDRRRESEVVTNRLRMKLYQKEVLRRLRSKK